MLHTANTKGVQQEVIIADEPQRLLGKEIILPIAEHDYGEAKADWVLRPAQQAATILKATNASGGGANAIAPAMLGKVYILINASGQAITLKAPGKTGIAVANAKVAVLLGNGSDFVRVTADA